jgi:hypothetical protein
LVNPFSFYDLAKEWAGSVESGIGDLSTILKSKNQVKLFFQWNLGAKNF